MQIASKAQGGPAAANEEEGNYRPRTNAYMRRQFTANLNVDMKLAPVNKDILIFNQKSNN